MNNKRRILALIEIFRRYSDENHHLKYSEIVSLLKDRDIDLTCRQTLYSDIKILNDFGYNIEYDDGYYLLDAPFYLSEIKLLIDSLNSLIELNDYLINNISNKLYSFVSLYDEKYLRTLSFSSKHKKSSLLNHLEFIIEAIKNHCAIIITTRYNKDEKEIFPLFLHRENNHYYFYYHYPYSNKVYHYRFDTIKDLKPSDRKDEISIQKEAIIKQIIESTDSFSSNDKALINIKILNTDERTRERLINDFPSSIITAQGISIKVSINKVLFGKFVAYGKDILIENEDIKEDIMHIFLILPRIILCSLLVDV